MASNSREVPDLGEGQPLSVTIGNRVKGDSVWVRVFVPSQKYPEKVLGLTLTDVHRGRKGGLGLKKERSMLSLPDSLRHPAAPILSVQ